MKNKINKMVKALVALFAFALTGAAVADTWEEPGTGITWTYEVDDGEVYIGDDTGCAVDPKPSGVVKIPATIAGFDVVAIGDYAFEGCDEITKVIVPIGVRSIGDYAFSTSDDDSYPYCTALTLVTIPSSVEYIGTCAFYGCTAMADENGFVIVNGVLYQYTGSATSVTVPAGVKEIGESAFFDCDSLTSVTLPDGLVRIGDYAFQACSALTGLTIPASVREIGAWAFHSCTHLSPTIPDTVTEIGNGAFYNCRAMSDANGFVIVRGALHFFDVTKTSEYHIEIPSGVTLICSRAFFGNSYITSVTIPYGVQEIGNMAFYNCSLLTDVVIPESVERIMRQAFNGSGLNKVYVVPDDTDRVRELIDKSKFPDAATLDFDEDVITPSAEYRTETVGGIKWKYHIVEGGAEIYNDDYTAIDDTTAGAITVPSTLGGFPVVSIGDYAFQDCDALTAVTIPASVRNIGYEAFWGCTALSSVALPVGLQTIDDWAFDECSSLSDISIPDSVDYIGDCAFYGCASMADAGGFVIVRGVLHYYAGSAANVTVPAGVKAIGSSAFDYNDTLISVTIPDGVTEIGSYAFDGCVNLASVEIADSVESIGSGAFRGCSSMADANGFVVVRRVLYHYAGSAANVEVPYGVQAISTAAFGSKKLGNSDITSVSIPYGLTSIGNLAFANCANLETVRIHSSVKRIGGNAFMGTSLATVHVESASEVDRVRSLITGSGYDGSLSFYNDLPATTICTVTFDADGGTCDPSSIQCVYSQPIGELPVAYKSGYTFTGWYTFKGSGGVQLTPETHVDGNKTYYAHYTENPPEYFKETVDGVEWTYCVVDGKAKISNGDDPAVPTTTSGEVTVPATLGGYPVTLIGDYAFDGCASITKLTVPSGVTGFGSFVFHSAALLRDLFIPKTVTDFTGLTFLTCSIDTIHVEKGDIDRVRTLIEATGYTSFDYDDGSVSPAPANDMFANATTISGVSGSVSGSNVDATFEAGEPLYVWKGCEATVWWTWTAPASGTVTFDTIGSTVDTVMGAYTGDAVASLTTIEQDDDSGGDSKSKISFDAVKDTTYRIAVATYGNGAGGELALNWNLVEATVYTVEFDVNGGDSVEFDSVDREAGAEIGALPDAEWSGHTFLGWFTETTGGDQISATTTVSGDVTYYAHWEEAEYKKWTDSETGIEWTYCVVDGEAEIYNNGDAAIPDTTAGAITVPSTLGGYPVTRIGDWAFDGCELLTSVTIPSGVTIIGEGAFSECYGLESVSLPEGLETIKDGAFQFCESLETISIPSTVTSIGDGVFQDCDALADGDGFIVVSGILFEYTGAGGDITIPSTVKTIWDGALYYTASLTGVTIPGSVKTVGYDAFGDSANLASVTFGRGVKTIGEVAFIRCAALTEARIPASVTSIGESAFGETALNKVYVEYGDTARVKALLEASYFDTTGVEFVEDAEPLVCTVTLELNGGSGVETSFDVDPGETIGLLPIPEGPEGQNGFQGWFWDSEFTDEVEPTDEVNGDCTCYAKWGGAVAVETTLVDGVAWSYFVDNKKKVVLYNNGRTVIPSDYEGALVIPSKIAGKSVVGIGERAFYGCTGLTSVIIPDGVNDINDKAFAWCESLKVVQFGKGASKGTIFFYVFKGCEWLKVLDFKGTTPPTVANYSAFEDAGTMTLEGKPIVYVPKSAAKKWGSEWTGMRVMPYSYSANIVMSVRPGKETYGSITPVVSGKATEIGKKVALKAKASSKAYVFAGWYDLDTGLRVSRSASYSYLVTGEDKRFEADFVDVGTDIDSLGIDVGDVWTDDDGTTFIDIGAAVSSCSEPKITVKGLPSGLKYDSKTQKISGQAKKPGVYKVTVTASNLSQKKAQTAEFELVVPNWTCDAMPNLEPDPDDYGTIWCGVTFNNELVDCTPALGWTVKASGLPTGLKWTNKVVLDKKTGAVIAKANTIYGVPTKPGNYTVTFTATRLREKQTATITLKVVARPEWATGTFNGGTAIDGAQFGDAYTMLEGAGQATLTIAANGKISGKILEGGRTWTISAASFDHGEHGEYIAHVTAKSGKETRSETILLEMYGLDVVGGMVTASGDLGEFTLYQTNWKADPWKTIAKNDAFKAAIKKELPYDRSDHEKARSANLSLKFAATGAVTVKGEFNIGGAVYKGSASATLVPLTEPDTTSNGAFTGEVCAYIPPKAGKFAGYFERLKVKWDGVAFSLVD